MESTKQKQSNSAVELPLFPSTESPLKLNFTNLSMGKPLIVSNASPLFENGNNQNTPVPVTTPAPTKTPVSVKSRPKPKTQNVKYKSAKVCTFMLLWNIL